MLRNLQKEFASVFKTFSFLLPFSSLFNYCLSWIMTLYNSSGILIILFSCFVIFPSSGRKNNLKSSGVDPLDVYGWYTLPKLLYRQIENNGAVDLYDSTRIILDLFLGVWRKRYRNAYLREIVINDKTNNVWIWTWGITAWCKIDFDDAQSLVQFQIHFGIKNVSKICTIYYPRYKNAIKSLDICLSINRWNFQQTWKLEQKWLSWCVMPIWGYF